MGFSCVPGDCGPADPCPVGSGAKPVMPGGSAAEALPTALQHKRCRLSSSWLPVTHETTHNSIFRRGSLSGSSSTGTSGSLASTYACLKVVGGATSGHAQSFPLSSVLSSSSNSQPLILRTKFECQRLNSLVPRVRTSPSSTNRNFRCRSVSQAARGTGPHE